MDTIRTKLNQISTPWLVTFIAIAMAISATSFYYTNQNNKSGILDIELKMITGWRLSHFVMYAIIGFLFPEKILLWFIVGLIWEVIELTLRNITNNDWWGTTTDYITDIIINLIGFIVGAYLYKVTM